MTDHAVTSEDALRRAESAQERVVRHRADYEAEIELRNAAIVDAYELDVGLRTIAKRVGISETTVHGIIAAN